MQSAAQALLSGGTALLESPTGTGKTLAVLSTVLAWQLHQKEHPRPAQPLISRWTAQGHQNGGADTGVQRIFWAARTHAQLDHVVRELRQTIYRPMMTLIASRERLSYSLCRLGGKVGCGATAKTAAGHCDRCHRKKMENSLVKRYHTAPHHTTPHHTALYHTAQHCTTPHRSFSYPAWCQAHECSGHPNSVPLYMASHAEGALRSSLDPDPPARAYWGPHHSGPPPLAHSGAPVPTAEC